VLRRAQKVTWPASFAASLQSPAAQVLANCRDYH
jgi:hypothetical protein